MPTEWEQNKEENDGEEEGFPNGQLSYEDLSELLTNPGHLPRNVERTDTVKVIILLVVVLGIGLYLLFGKLPELPKIEVIWPK